MRYYQAEIKELYKKFNSSVKGLSNKRAKIALAHFGKNEIKRTKKISPIKIFLSQFNSFIVYILIGAFLISLALGFMHETPQEKFDSYIDAGVIFAILIINAVLGFFQEFRAEKSIEALKKLASLQAFVKREGVTKKIDAALLVPGDIIILETGEKVPADARLIETHSLEAQEAALTGESLPVIKDEKIIKRKTEIADQKNMVFSGTILTKGRGKAIVCATGRHTQIGKIAKLIEEQKATETPLQHKLEQLGKWLGLMVLLIVFIVFSVGVLKGVNIEQMFMAAIALAVAAVPEGLAAVVTISLALGIQRMIRKNALVRKLPSVETLGSTTVICSDKTGTLTKNEMTVKKIFTNNEVIDVSGTGYEIKGKFSKNPKDFELLLKCGVMCNDAIVHDTVIGDPTEGALIISAAKANLRKKQLLRKNPRIHEIPFDSERKMMSTIHKEGKRRTIYTKGAPENVLKKCTHIMIKGYVEELNKEKRDKILEQNQKFAHQALRVLGFAYKKLSHKHAEEKGLIFLGLQAMIDPPRQEDKLAIKQCRKAGIKVVMITGDHKETAVAIAKELGIRGKAITGEEITSIKNLKEHVQEIGVYARVNPEHKLKIVKALQAKGHVVAMTGDGVNDAPALKKAEIGIAMGITGTDVAKEASEMILTDDNFSSIVNAVEEGRGIYNNIKNYVKYTLSSNLSEVMVIFLAILFNWPLPLTAIQILWINLLTDGLPAVALVSNKADKNIMRFKPRPKKEPIITNYDKWVMIGIAIVMTIASLGMFYKYTPDFNIHYAQTIVFTVLIITQMFNALNASSETESVFKKGLLSNIYLILAISLSIGMQVAIIYVPVLAKLFKVVPLTGMDWLYITIVSSSILILGESVKLIRRKNLKLKRKGEWLVM